MATLPHISLFLKSGTPYRHFPIITQIRTDRIYSYSHSGPLHSSHWQNIGNANPTNSQLPNLPLNPIYADTPRANSNTAKQD
jgi:hypothetical protein